MMDLYDICAVCGRGLIKVGSWWRHMPGTGWRNRFGAHGAQPMADVR